MKEDRMTGYSHPAIRRLCLAVGTEPGSQPATGRPAADLLSSTLAEACHRSGLDRALVNTRAVDAGVVALLPPGIDEPHAIVFLINGLNEALHRLNAEGAGPTPLRLKVAFDEGLTVLADLTFGGQAMASACRLLDSQQLRLALSRDPQTWLAVILSERVYSDMSSFPYPSLPISQFQRVDVGDAATAWSDVGWIYVSGPEVLPSSPPHRANSGENR
jgi:hypothetical protein